MQLIFSTSTCTLSLLIRVPSNGRASICKWNRALLTLPVMKRMTTIWKMRRLQRSGWCQLTPLPVRLSSPLSWCQWCDVSDIDGSFMFPCSVLHQQWCAVCSGRPFSGAVRLCRPEPRSRSGRYAYPPFLLAALWFADSDLLSSTPYFQVNSL